MSVLMYLVAYLAIAVFAIAVAVRFFGYLRNPIHVRWELYPVAHEGKRASYGGSYLEEVDWWEKPREVSMLGELKVMIPEILFLKAVWEHNRPLWFVSFPFHFGLYLIAALIGLLGVGAIAQLAGAAVGPGAGGLGSWLHRLPVVLGPIAFGLCGLGALGLLLRRLLDADIRRYSSVGHYFNLALFLVVLGLAAYTWRAADADFALARGFLANLIAFRLEPVGGALFGVQVIVASLLLAYIPLTHMSHFFMKYFLYHDIRWGDEPNVDSPKTAARIATVLNYPVTWAAPHVAIPGRSTWAEVATFNPAAEAEEDKEQ